MALLTQKTTSPLALALMQRQSEDPDGAAGGTFGPGNPDYGKLSSEVTTGMRGLEAANLAAGLMGFGVPGLGPALGMFGLASALAPDPMQQSIQNVAMFGNPGMAGWDMGTVAPGMIGNPAQGLYGGWEGMNVASNQPTAIGYGPPGIGGANMGQTSGTPSAEMGGESGNQGTGGASSVGGETGATGGMGTGGGSDPFAKGGAVFATHPMSATFGEPSTGGETAIFIPEWMKQPGIQNPQELQVRRALRQALLQLGGR
jgi:hypothetical protein